MRPRVTRGLACALACVTLLTAPSPTAPAGAPRNITAIEFLESPPTGLVVSGGLLGVPDSTGSFPAEFRRDDPASGNIASPGMAAGNHLVFTDLKPGTYRLALVLLSESRFASRFLPKHERPLTDRCRVYSDSLPALTFRIGDQEMLYLGRLTRRSRPALGKEELWSTTLDWAPGDERRAWRGMLKHKRLSPWKRLMERRIQTLDSVAGRGTRLVVE